MTAESFAGRAPDLTEENLQSRIRGTTLMALSNKDFIGESLGRPKDDRLEGSLAAATACILLGARIVRMHAVPESIAAVRMTEAILGFRKPIDPVHNL